MQSFADMHTTSKDSEWTLEYILDFWNLALGSKG